MTLLEKMTLPFLPYMDRPCDTQAGMKHRCTASALRYLRSEVMEMCQRENLYQIDLLNGSKNRITEREYHAKRRGQWELDELNQQIIADGLTPRRTKFETDKNILRGNIRSALLAAKSFEEFQELLAEQGIAVWESRGRFSYLTADRTKPITAYNGVDLTEYYEADTLKSKLGEEIYCYYMENYGGVYYSGAYWDGENTLNGDIAKAGSLAPAVKAITELYNEQSLDKGALWITVHTSVYDLETLTLDIQVRESHDHIHFTIG